MENLNSGVKRRSEEWIESGVAWSREEKSEAGVWSKGVKMQRFEVVMCDRAVGNT